MTERISMILDRVTITGADDSVNPTALLELSRQYPFVEFGILLSFKAQGNNRFPSNDWLNKFIPIAKANPAMRVALHVCGRWAFQTYQGLQPVKDLFPELWAIARRVQLNTHGERLLPIIPYAGLSPQITDKQVIVQMDAVNDPVLHQLREFGCDAVPLFDTSGGAGILPSQWPDPVDNCYCGFAGGLSPENVLKQLDLIAAKVGAASAWIDMEAKVRANDDKILDLGKVASVLYQCAPRVTEWVCS
jgi:hypothetical protein